MAVTGRGFSYVLPGDAISDYPAISLALANKLDSDPALVTAAAFAALTPVDRMEVYLIADAALGIAWHLRYNSGSISAYKWEFLGGAYLFNDVVTNETTASATYVDLTTVGPTLTVPRAGEYEIEFGAQCSNATASMAQIMAAKIGAAAANDLESQQVVNSGINLGISTGRVMRRTCAASDVIKAQYKTGGGVGSWTRRWLRVRPFRIS